MTRVADDRGVTLCLAVVGWCGRYQEDFFFGVGECGGWLPVAGLEGLDFCEFFGGDEAVDGGVGGVLGGQGLRGVESPYGGIELVEDGVVCPGDRVDARVLVGDRVDRVDYRREGFSFVAGGGVGGNECDAV